MAYASAQKCVNQIAHRRYVSSNLATAEDYGLGRGELGHAKASSSTPPYSPHRIGIVVSTEGRFLHCNVCKLSYVFPDGVEFGTVAKQFALYPCDSTAGNANRRTADIGNAYHGKERCLVILRYERKIPVMASCARCERKFFTPTTFTRDAIAAEQYLAQRFNVHKCE